MLHFENRTAPQCAPANEWPDMSVPKWWQDAKLGIFIHWGLYSVPAWAVQPPDGTLQPEDAFTFHAYAEWYENTLKIQGSPTEQYHKERYGVGTTYEDLASLWELKGDWSASNLIDPIKASGAKYVVPTTKHHDGFCLWDTTTTPFNAFNRGPKRNLIKELAEEIRAKNMRLGLYFSGAHDWHLAPNFPPIRSMTDLFVFRRNDKEFSKYTFDQAKELVEQFAPDLFWNDIEWPNEGKANNDFGLIKLFNYLLEQNGEAVINDRFGVPFYGYLTREYADIKNTINEPWESTRGLGLSFGYNQNEASEHTLDSKEVIRLLIDVVSKNGNLLLNVGPKSDGTLPDEQKNILLELGSWMKDNGAGIYDTRPWVRFGDDHLRYTRKDDRIFVYSLDPKAPLVLPTDLADKDIVGFLGVNDEVVSDGSAITVPTKLQETPSFALELYA